jgi:hypothetical protein
MPSSNLLATRELRVPVKIIEHDPKPMRVAVKVTERDPAPPRSVSVQVTADSLAPW